MNGQECLCRSNVMVKKATENVNEFLEIICKIIDFKVFEYHNLFFSSCAGFFTPNFIPLFFLILSIVISFNHFYYLIGQLELIKFKINENS